LSVILVSVFFIILLHAVHNCPGGRTTAIVSFAQITSLVLTCMENESCNYLSLHSPRNNTCFLLHVESLSSDDIDDDVDHDVDDTV